MTFTVWKSNAGLLNHPSKKHINHNQSTFFLRTQWGKTAWVGWGCFWIPGEFIQRTACKNKMRQASVANPGLWVCGVHLFLAVLSGSQPDFVTLVFRLDLAVCQTTL